MRQLDWDAHTYSFEGTSARAALDPAAGSTQTGVQHAPGHAPGQWQVAQLQGYGNFLLFNAVTN